MSGKPWTAERRAQFSAAMTQRWKRGDYARRKPADIDPADRAARSARMRKLNFRMSYDETLKAKCVRGQVRARRSPAYRAVQSAVLHRDHGAPRHAPPGARALHPDQQKSANAKTPMGDAPA